MKNNSISVSEHLQIFSDVDKLDLKSMKMTISLYYMCWQCRHFYNVKLCEERLNNDSGQSWSWSNGSWIYNYSCNQCLSPQMLWVRISIRARCTTLYDKVFQWLATGRWFSPGSPTSYTNKTDRHDITEILLKVALITIKQTN
jgi:hypothetical protein